MTDVFTKGGIRRKRPEPDEPQVKAARVERQARLRVPLRAQIEIEGVHGDLDPTKADIRDLAEDSRREKNASLRDKENDDYATRRDIVLAQWADKAERRERRDNPKQDIITRRKEREAMRTAMLEGAGADELLMPDAASPEAVRRILEDGKRAPVRKPRKPKSLTEQVHALELEEVLEPRLVQKISKGR